MDMADGPWRKTSRCMRGLVASRLVRPLGKRRRPHKGGLSSYRPAGPALRRPPLGTKKKEAFLLRFSVDVGEFSAALGSVLRVLPTRAARPVLSCAHLMAVDGALTVCGTDLDNVVRAVVPAQVEQEGATVVNARYLADVLHRFSAGPLRWDLDAQNNTSMLTWERARVTVRGLAPEDYLRWTPLSRRLERNRPKPGPSGGWGSRCPPELPPPCPPSGMANSTRS